MQIESFFHKYLSIALAPADEDGADGAAPDAPASDAAPAAQDAGEAEGEGEAGDSDTQASPEPKEEAEAKPNGEDKPQEQEPWYKKRIAELTYQKNEEARQRQAYEQRLAEYERQQQQQQQRPEDQQRQQQRQYTEEEVHRRAEYLANQRAAAIAAETEFNNRCNAVFASGAQEYGQQEFKRAVEAFHTDYGGMPQDFVEAALETGAAEKVIYELGKNPEKAMEVLSLPPGIKRVSAVMKLANSLAAQKPKVSGAPAPIKPQVGGSGRVDPTLEKADSIDKWMEMRNKQLATRQ